MQIERGEIARRGAYKVGKGVRPIDLSRIITE